MTIFSDKWLALLSVRSHLSDSAMSVVNGSDYVAQWGERHEARAEELLSSGDLERVYDEATLASHLACRLEHVGDEAQLHQQLRHFRQREMVRIIWRDLAGWADLAETVCDLSSMADVCLQQALDVLHQWQCIELGTPYSKDKIAQELIVLGMGKLGAGELNLSSDIDLIFTYPESGETQGGRRSLTNEEFFTRLGRKLIQALDNVTVDGFVFRVDMRLRPFGESGVLVANFDAMEDYYQTQGREWERYAMIKARAITGVDESRKVIMDLLRPFVYRRYLDYGVFDALRDMKRMIAAQLYKKGMEDNIKLGSGGIREIEFIGQVFQLIYGGRDTPLQQRPILTILDLLAERDLLEAHAVNELKQAYDFLRRTEHRIQAWADKQTHLLPQDEVGQERIARLMSFDNWHDFANTLATHREQVQSHFEVLLTVFQSDDESPSFLEFETNKRDTLHGLGYVDLDKSVQALDNVINSHNCRNLAEVERGRLEKLLPLLVNEAAKADNADVCLSRLLRLLDAIMRRSSYMSLLVENPTALTQLVSLCAASPWISNQLTRHPVLLDELLDPRSLYSVPTREQKQTFLENEFKTIEPTDLEKQMHVLREFKHVSSLHIAAADITQALPLMTVGDELTELAEILLDKVMYLAWRHLVVRHGYPPCTESDDLSRCGLSVLAYGKMGGLELGYGSDLDIVFLLNDDASQGMTSGDKPIDSLLFYIRFAQRMIHIMNTVTVAGILYEVDMRLRPNGASGLLVTTLSAFETYQDKEAWTWEHQALVRARCVAGDVNVDQKFQTIRQQIIHKKRDKDTLVGEVSDMRAKMRKNLDKSTQKQFDLKQGSGGITDIEFMVQYAVLAWSSDEPELGIYTDNIRILDALKQIGKLSEQEADLLANAYRFYRHRVNHCVLQEQLAYVLVDEVKDYPAQVTKIWQQWLR